MKPFTRQFALMGSVLAGFAVAGCSQSADSGGSEMDDLAAMLDRPKQAAPEPQPPTPVAPQPAPPPVAAAPADNADNETTITITVKNPQNLMQGAKEFLDRDEFAESTAQPRQSVGSVGKRQRRNTIQGPLRYYGAISNARIVFEDRALGWQIQKSMDFYVNTHDGKYPQTTEEFMKEIIEQYEIVLPELRPGQEFFYDPEDHELKIGELIEEPAADDATADETAAGEPRAQQ